MPGGGRILSAGVTDGADTQRLRRQRDRHAAAHNSQISRSERRFFPNTHRWVCAAWPPARSSISARRKLRQALPRTGQPLTDT
jgi:hypothetical protein